MIKKGVLEHALAGLLWREGAAPVKPQHGVCSFFATLTPSVSNNEERLEFEFSQLAGLAP